MKRKVAKLGGKAFHEKRGLQAVDIERRREISRKGGLARWGSKTEKIDASVLERPASVTIPASENPPGEA